MSRLLSVRVINLRGSTDRWVTCTQRLMSSCPGLDIQRFDAYGPSGHPFESNMLTKRELACLASHFGAMGECSAASPLLVLEDDVWLSKATLSFLNAVLLAQPSFDWDLIFLGMTESIENLSVHRRLLELAKQVVPSRGISLLDAKVFYKWGAFAYLVSPRAVDKLMALKDFEKDIGFPLQIDLALRKYIRSGFLNAKLVFPYLATVDLTHSTTMEDRTSAGLHLLHASHSQSFFFDNLQSSFLADKQNFHELLVQQLLLKCKSFLSC